MENNQEINKNKNIEKCLNDEHLEDVNGGLDLEPGIPFRRAYDNGLLLGTVGTNVDASVSLAGTVCSNKDIVK